MPEKKAARESDIQELLVNAAEVQLAALKAGISFWSVWVEQASRFTEVATKGLSIIKSSPADTNRLLLEITDASRESLRAMRDLPRHVAERFIEELDEFNKTRKSSKRGSTKRKARRFVRAKD